MVDLDRIVDPFTDERMEDWRSNLSLDRRLDFMRHRIMRTMMTMTAMPNTEEAILITAT